MFAITGITGRVGGIVARTLLTAKEPVRAVVRDAGKGAPWQERGCQLAPGKPSWMLVATKDRAINPDLERWYAERARSHPVEVSGASHSVYVSRPKDVAAVIMDAAAKAPH
jgi:uncharacterized protein YbjT (DUF2867 family)